MRDATDVEPANVRARFQLIPSWIAMVLPSDGLLTFLMTCAIVAITIISIQAVRPVWADGLGMLTPAMIFGMGMGYVALKQNLIRGNLMHLLALVTGCLVSFFLTSNTLLNGNRAQLLYNVSVWIQRSLIKQQVSTDNSVFVLFLGLLTFLLAYLTIWLVFIARRPWLGLVANAVVLMINMNQSTNDQYYLLVVFLVITLLLLVRFALAEHVRQWRRTGLRFSPDLGWDFMQAGAIFAVIVAVVPNLLPFSQPNQTLLTYLTSDQSPITQVQEKFQSLFGGVNGKGSGSYSFFDNNLTLVGTVNLPDTPILSYTLPISTQADGAQYLMTEAFSTYDNVGVWQRAQAVENSYSPRQILPASSAATHLDTYRITFLATPTGGQRYIFTPGGEAESFSIASAALNSVVSRENITWYDQSPIPNGGSYTATGYVSSATIAELQSVPYPAAADVASSSTPFPAEMLSENLPQSEPIDPYITSTAEEVTAGATNMYDAATDIENYLHQNFTYSTHNPNPPTSEDATVWFLQRKQGFCTFFASAMALMARSLGMPARVVSGYATGSYDSHSNSYVVRGTQAHTWTQIYFGQYGWINFEPTSGFGAFARALPNGQSTGQGGTVATPQATAGPAQRGRTDRTTSSAPGAENATQSTLTNIAFGLGALAILLLVIAGAIAYWWRSLFKSYSPVARGFARLTVLGSVLGAKPRRSQTPREYARQLAQTAPAQRESLERVGAAYSRERWGAPLTEVEVSSINQAYERGRSGLIRVLLRRARQTPGDLVAQATRRARLRRRQPAARRPVPRA